LLNDGPADLFFQIRRNNWVALGGPALIRVPVIVYEWARVHRRRRLVSRLLELFAGDALPRWVSSILWVASSMEQNPPTFV